jgi:hypothetical protein
MEDRTQQPRESLRLGFTNDSNDRVSAHRQCHPTSLRKADPTFTARVDKGLVPQAPGYKLIRHPLHHCAAGRTTFSMGHVVMRSAASTTT